MQQHLVRGLVELAKILESFALKALVLKQEKLQNKGMRLGIVYFFTCQLSYLDNQVTNFKRFN